jgi:hypothetical protein
MLISIYPTNTNRYLDWNFNVCHELQGYVISTCAQTSKQVLGHGLRQGRDLDSYGWTIRFVTTNEIWTTIGTRIKILNLGHGLKC